MAGNGKAVVAWTTGLEGPSQAAASAAAAHEQETTILTCKLDQARTAMAAAQARAEAADLRAGVADDAARQATGRELRYAMGSPCTRRPTDTARGLATDNLLAHPLTWSLRIH